MALRRRTLIAWILAGAALAVAGFLAYGLLWLREVPLHRRLADKLGEAFDSDVTLGQLDVSMFPHPRIVGTNLVMRKRGRDARIPLITADRFQVDFGWRSVFSGRAKLVDLDGLKLTIPPRTRHRSVEAPTGTAPPTPDAEAASDPEATPTRTRDVRVFADHVVAHDAILTFVPRSADKRPRVFRIHQLNLNGVGPGLSMPYEASLTNHSPKGVIRADGAFGPWNKVEPGDTTVGGQYRFTDADLGPLKGIGGTLVSTGRFEGPISHISVDGDTDTPGFNLDVGGHAVPLRTMFHAFVDGTNGDTFLEAVDARLGDTPITAKGAIERVEDEKGRRVVLDLVVQDGRIEDLLRLAMKAQRPLLAGVLRLRTKLHLPTGSGRAIERLEMDGTFGLDDASFGSAGMRSKFAELSARGRGQPRDEVPENVVMDLQGRFTLRKGRLSVPDLRFRVPGASVQLAGSYHVLRDWLDFEGAVKLDASMSKVVGGVKSFFLRPFNGLFRKDGAGTYVPITIQGRSDDPNLDVQIRKMIRGK